MNHIILIAFSLLLVVSCKKAEDRTCFKSWGNETTKEIPLVDFSKLELKEHMEFVLIQDSLNKLVVKAGENMVNLIKAEENEFGFLQIRNESKCRFLRNKKKVVQVEIHFTTLTDLNFGGTEKLTNQGILALNDFKLTIRDGAGPVVLRLNANHVDADVTHGNGDYTLIGNANSARISAKSNGYCDVTGLLVQNSIFVVSETVCPMKINANGLAIEGYQKESGDIYYVGTPAGINVVQTGEGKVLPL